MTDRNPAKGNQLTMVVAPASDHAEGLNLKGLVEFMGQKAGVDIDLKYCNSYEEAISALETGAAEIGWLGPFAYLEAVRSGAVEAFAVGVPKGKSVPNYHSVFITKAGSDIEELKDVKNRRIAVNNEHSTSGYIVPEKDLAEIGINLDDEHDFAEVHHVRTHDDAIKALINGDVDVTPVSSVNLEENIRKGVLKKKAFRIIHTSLDIPGPPLVFIKDLAPELKSMLKRLALDAHNHIEVGGYGGAMEKYVDPKESKTLLLQSYLRPQWGWRSYASITALVLLTALVTIDLEVNPLDLAMSASTYLVDIIGRMLPPDFSKFDELAFSMLETIEIGFLGTLLAITISMPIGLMSARNIAPNKGIFLTCRLITVFFRSIPEFIMAMILVIAVGFGAMPGVIALGLHTMGFLAKFYAEDIEHVDTGPIEALSSLGASRRQLIAFAIAPQILPSFIGYNLYIFDRNIRMATMLGIVGAGGIGYELQSSFRMFEYPRVSAIIILIFGTIFFIDMISSYVRAKVQ